MRHVQGRQTGLRWAHRQTGRGTKEQVGIDARGEVGDVHHRGGSEALTQTHKGNEKVLTALLITLKERDIYVHIYVYLWQRPTIWPPPQGIHVVGSGGSEKKPEQCILKKPRERVGTASRLGRRCWSVAGGPGWRFQPKILRGSSRESCLSISPFLPNFQCCDVNNQCT